MDQLFKIYVKTHFELGYGFPISSFFWIFFVENPGMAYGFYIIPGYVGKIVLSIFRCCLIIFMFFFHINNIKKRLTNYLIIPTSLILSGSIGNCIDSILYGILFNIGTIYSKKDQKWLSYSGISKINSFYDLYRKGYASFFEGCVVDMFYFPMIDCFLPKWIPVFGGVRFQFFKPVFNVSDISIFLGIIFLLLFRRKIKNVKFF